jgi:uncharacterized membrane protein
MSRRQEVFIFFIGLFATLSMAKELGVTNDNAFWVGVFYGLASSIFDIQLFRFYDR